MKTIISTLIAASVLGLVALPANAFDPKERAAGSRVTLRGEPSGSGFMPASMALFALM